MQFTTAVALRVYRVGCNNDVITTASDNQRGTVAAGGQKRSDEDPCCSVFLRHVSSLAGTAGGSFRLGLECELLGTRCFGKIGASSRKLDFPGGREGGEPRIRIQNQSAPMDRTRRGFSLSGSWR